MLTSLQKNFSRLLAWYGSAGPSHRGKWRILDLAIQYGGLQSGYDAPVIATRRGRKFELDLNSHIDQVIYYQGNYEAWDTLFLETVVQPDWVMLDIGVNIGWHSLMAGKKIGPAGKIYAFDISNDELQKFRRNLELNRITVAEPILAAMSDVSGTARITETLGAGQTALVVSGQTGREIEATSLDDFAARRKLTRLDLIKIDIEGAEMKFLIGGEKTLRQFQPILMMELNDHALRQFGQAAGILTDRLERLGFRLFRSRRPGLVPLARLPAGKEYFNLIALPARLARDNTPRDWAAIAKLGTTGA